MRGVQLDRSDTKRRRAQLSGKRRVAGDLDSGYPLPARAEYGELTRVAGQGRGAARFRSPCRPGPAR